MKKIKKDNAFLSISKFFFFLRYYFNEAKFCIFVFNLKKKLKLFSSCF